MDNITLAVDAPCSPNPCIGPTDQSNGPAEIPLVPSGLQNFGEWADNLVPCDGDYFNWPYADRRLDRKGLMKRRQEDLVIEVTLPPLAKKARGQGDAISEDRDEAEYTESEDVLPNVRDIPLPPSSPIHEVIELPLGARNHPEWFVDAVKYEEWWNEELHKKEQKINANIRQFEAKVAAQRESETQMLPRPGDPEGNSDGHSPVGEDEEYDPEPPSLAESTENETMQLHFNNIFKNFYMPGGPPSIVDEEYFPEAPFLSGFQEYHDLGFIGYVGYMAQRMEIVQEEYDGVGFSGYIGVMERNTTAAGG